MLTLTTLKTKKRRRRRNNKNIKARAIVNAWNFSKTFKLRLQTTNFSSSFLLNFLFFYGFFFLQKRVLFRILFSRFHKHFYSAELSVLCVFFFITGGLDSFFSFLLLIFFPAAKIQKEKNFSTQFSLFFVGKCFTSVRFFSGFLFF